MKIVARKARANWQFALPVSEEFNMSRCDALKEWKAPLGAPPILFCGVALLTEQPAGKDACAPRDFTQEV